VYILDSCVLRAVFVNKGQQPLLEQRIRSTPYEHLFTTIINVHEEMLWVLETFRRRINKGQVSEAYSFLLDMYLDHATFQILPLDEEAVTIYRNMTPETKRIGTGDCLTAAIAIRHGYTVITHNMDDFERIPNCLCRDWSRPDV
jgi:predicted nucleic acid-binding protein